ncbi:MAG: type IV toxin-antitoxin system AbiEi family antitoxin domain-containing protein [Desulforhopalus sp.]
MKKHPNTTPTTKNALSVIRKRGGIIRTAEALKSGIHPRTFYLLRDQGYLERISRGVYRLTDLPAVSNPDFILVASRVPHAVICLISALSFHQLTTQVPHEVFIALQEGTKTPRIDFPPLSVHHFSQTSFGAGIKTYEIDGVSVRIYNQEKTLADCFKFRNKLGMDVALEALKMYRSRNTKINIAELLKYARICRVEKIMQPYLESIA